MDWLIKRQGKRLVARDPETQEILKDSKGRLKVALVPDGPKMTWRRALGKLTEGGRVLEEVLMSLAAGNAYEATLPDGRKSQPIVPSPEVRRAAAVDLLHMLRGKPVSQTEVLQAEKDAENLERYAAYSDEEIARAARPYLERVLPKESETPEDD